MPAGGAYGLSPEELVAQRDLAVERENQYRAELDRRWRQVARPGVWEKGNIDPIAMQQAADYAMRMAQSRRASQAFTRALLANMDRESNFNPRAKHPKYNSFGINQLHLELNTMGAYVNAIREKRGEKPLTGDDLYDYKTNDNGGKRND